MVNKSTNLKRITLTYLYGYLTVGGIGLAFFPTLTLRLFMSNGEYDNIMPRMVGIFMCVLAFLIYQITRLEDWKYYRYTIIARSVIVLFLTWIFFVSQDPMFLILIGIVLIGLVPSILILLWPDQPKK